MRKYLLIALLLAFFHNLFCQERLGICNSVYAGVNSLWINPASIAGSPFSYDINILTVHSFLDNNDVYLYKANIPILLKNTKNEINSNNDYNQRHGVNSKIEIYDNYNNKNKNLYQRLLIQGPSVMFAFKKWNFAITTGIREEVSLLKVNNKLAKLAYEGMVYESLSKQYIYIPEFRLSGTAWSEIGISAATTIKQDRDKIIKAGISLKYLMGYSNLYLKHKSSTIIYQNDDDMDFYFLNAEYGHAINDSKIEVLGRGQNVDLGVSYQKPISHRLKEKNRYYYDKGQGCPYYCKPNPYLLYKWKIGLSLIDIGYLTWNKNAKTYLFTNATSTWYNFAHWAPNGIEGTDKGLNSHFNNDSTASPQKTSYTTLLPMAFSGQFDYNFGGNFYINATIVQRLPHFNTAGTDRSNLFSLTPRFDSPYLGIALPVTFYEYIYPHFGLALRLGNYLSAGTDNIMSFAGNKLSGMDLYLSLKINNLKKCKKSKNNSW